MQSEPKSNWDAIVVGAGHNGLCCAIYLARAGKKVLVLEARDRVGGACTLEETWPGYTISPCAYLCGLLHPLIVEELDLPARGFEWVAADTGLFVPFEDGESIQLWDDDDLCREEIRRWSPKDLDGWLHMQDAKRRLRDALRPPDENDTWVGRAPSREAMEDRLGNDRELLNILFNWSMVELVEHYLEDERLQTALLGQGVIGTNASPFDPGTASIHFHHSSGRMFGQAGAWGYVKGGMGSVSFLLRDIAESLGVEVQIDKPVARMLPEEGVALEGGEIIHAPIIISNADPVTTLKLLDSKADEAWKQKVESIPIEGCTVKVTLALNELPNFNARPGLNQPHHHGQINTPLSKKQWRDGFAKARKGELPDQLWTELYIQTTHDPSVAPSGKHVMSVFAQYVPYRFSKGTWEARRQEVGDLALSTLGKFCRNIPAIVDKIEIMGPPDIERKVGLAGGHIFQGECLPDNMWSNRLTPKTPMPGVYLCGACTHPGGSVIGINGRNAAMEILQG